jgi:hypothetical protein
VEFIYVDCIHVTGCKLKNKNKKKTAEVIDVKRVPV